MKMEKYQALINHSNDVNFDLAMRKDYNNIKIVVSC